MRRTSLLLLASSLGLVVAACAGRPRSPNGRSALGAHVSAPASTSAAPASAVSSAVPSAAPPSGVRTLLAAISSDRMRADVARLVAFGTRHTLSETTSDTRGIGAARRWIQKELLEAARAAGRSDVTVELESERIAADGKRIPRETELVNVVAVLPGSNATARERRYYVVGHYDSRATDVMDATSDAPGANDDASGVAVVLELARVLCRAKLDATVVFLATAGEEQGLLGAKMHARRAKERGERIIAVLNDDIVGDPSSRHGPPHRSSIRLFSEGLPRAATADDVERTRQMSAESDSPSREIARYAAEVARWESLPVQPELVFRPDRFLRGGDHLAFNELGFAGVRFTVPEEHFERQHENVRSEGGVAYGDVAERVDPAYLADVARLNGAVLVHLASAPAAPSRARILTAKLDAETSLAWDASPEPDVAGYEIVYRRTTSPVWEHAVPVGTATRTRLDVSKDDVIFGVRAVDRGGFRSPVAFATASRD